jgi:hypothetical protein
MPDPPPRPPPLSVSEAGGARLWEIDLPTAFDVVADPDGWPALVKDWPRFWALHASWALHLGRRDAPPKGDVKNNPRKRPGAAFERALVLSPPDGGPGAPPRPDSLVRLQAAQAAARGGTAPTTTTVSVDASSSDDSDGGVGLADASSPDDGPDIARPARLASAAAAAAKAFWEEDGLYTDAIDNAIRIVQASLPRLAAAGVPVPEYVPAYDVERDAFTVFTDREDEAAWDTRWRTARDDVARPRPVPIPSPFAGWTGVEVRAWAEKRASHAADDAAFAWEQAKVGAFIEADATELTDVRMARAVADVPDFKHTWTHDEIMGVITNGGLSAHPDAVRGALGITAPGTVVDYWEEGIHWPATIEDTLDAAGRLAGPGTRGPPELADPAGWGVAFEDEDGEGGAAGGSAAGLSPRLVAEAAAAAATVPESMSGMAPRPRAGVDRARASGGAGSASADDDDEDEEDGGGMGVGGGVGGGVGEVGGSAGGGTAASATLDEPFADFDDGSGGPLGGEGGGSLLDPADDPTARTRGGEYDEDEPEE